MLQIVFEDNHRYVARLTKFIILCLNFVTVAKYGLRNSPIFSPACARINFASIVGIGKVYIIEHLVQFRQALPYTMS